MCCYSDQPVRKRTAKKFARAARRTAITLIITVITPVELVMVSAKNGDFGVNVRKKQSVITLW